MSKKVNRFGIGLLIFLSMLGGPTLATAAVTADAASPADRLIVIARSDADYDSLRAAVVKAGGTVLNDMRASGMIVVKGTPAVRSQIQGTGLAKAVAKDHLESITSPETQRDLFNNPGVKTRTQVDASRSLAAAQALNRTAATTAAVPGDPANTFPGLMWNLTRIEAPAAWQRSTGSGDVIVGVADTGLDFTHSELGPRISFVHDFTQSEDPPICKTFFANPFDPSAAGIGDEDLHEMFGGPALTDWNGHGSWIGGNIAAQLNGLGTNGIAPNVKLFGLKISQWCGSAYDSEIMDAFTYAWQHNIDIVSISFGGYLDLTDPDQAAIWGKYNQVVQEAHDHGTIIVASSGNEHVQVGAAGLVTSSGPLTNPCTSTASSPCPAFNDLLGHYETPGGIPGVVDVSATGNVVAAPNSQCLPDQIGSATDLNPVCKPTSDHHQPTGVGRQDQLAYYSNYGPRIDVAGPGGARKFNLPFWDRGGTPGFPYTSDDMTTDFEDFSTTSNWAIEIPCFTFTNPAFPANQCYSAIQGTSMATPHASAVLALIASSRPSERHDPDHLLKVLKETSRKVTGNQTGVLAPTDFSHADLTDQQCHTGYCHLSGRAVADNEAYGAGIVDARRAVTP
jgi:subtilisin family serine protease